MNDPVDYFDSESLRKDLKGKTVRGGVATMAAQTATILINLATLPIYSRLLDPEDFGLIAMVMVFTGFAGMFVDSGLSMATVQREQVTRQQVSNLFWIAFAAGSLVAALMAAAAAPISWFFNEPRLIGVSLALASQFVFSGLTIQHQALLRRAMELHRLAAVRLASIFVGQAMGIGWAWWFRGQPIDYYALVLIPITTSISSMLLMWLACSWRPGLPRRNAGTRGMVEFGANLLGFNVVNYFSRNADNLLIGWWWGAAPLGYYNQAYRLFMKPMQSINGPIGGVIVPALSRLRGDPGLYETTYFKAIRLLMIFVWPLVVMTAIAADCWVVAVLSDKWAMATPIYRCLAVVGIVQVITNTAGWLFASQGKSREMLNTSLVNGPVTVAAFFVGLPWGPVGVAAAYAFGSIVFRVPYLLYRMHHYEVLDVFKLAREVACFSVPALAVAVANLALVASLPNKMSEAGVPLSASASATVWALAVYSMPECREAITELLSSLFRVWRPAEESTVV